MTIGDDGLAVVTSAFGLTEAEFVRALLADEGIEVVVRRAHCAPADGEPACRYVFVPREKFARARAVLEAPA